MTNNIKSLKSVLVTGSEGFIGRNLIEALGRKSNVSILSYDIQNSKEDLLLALQKVDVIFHIAGVNRPVNEEEFKQVNTDLTTLIVEVLQKRVNKPLLVLSSSVQATLDNPYGKSKLDAEKAIEYYGSIGGAGVIFRLPNVFGKWSRPNYNSAVATFCYNIARGLEITVRDPLHEIDLIYIDDVIRGFVGLLDQRFNSGTHRMDIGPVKRISLEDLTNQIIRLRKIRTDLLLPDFNDQFTKKLYATYLSFLPTDNFAYSLMKREDQRGALAELIKSPNIGQIFVSRTKPGFTRGNHYHHTKVEKFCVLEGDAIIRFRHISNADVVSYTINGGDFRVLDIPPGYTHSIENIGNSDCIVLFWASEIYNQDEPDTFQEYV